MIPYLRRISQILLLVRACFKALYIRHIKFESREGFELITITISVKCDVKCYVEYKYIIYEGYLISSIHSNMFIIAHIYTIN